MPLFDDSHDFSTQARGGEHEPCDTIVQNIMLSIWDGDADTQTKALDRKDAIRARNRACARQGRESDRVYTELVLAELNSIAETLVTYASYIAELKLHGACAADCMHGLELCSTHAADIALVQRSDMRISAQALSGISIKERNRIHAQKSRCRKSHFLRDIIRQRDTSLSTVLELVQYTSTLESSCAVLNDFDAPATVFLTLTDVRQRLLQRVCRHSQQSETLKSALAYRATHRTKRHIT